MRAQELSYRWGHAASRRSTSNCRTLQLPPWIIDYVVLHELVHVIEPRPDSTFWRKVERVMPDYGARKEWLAEHGQQFLER